MRIACLQFSPQVGEVTKNLSKADAILAASSADLSNGIDLLVLPEMSFSGYNFRSQSHIIPFLESPSAGPTSSWAMQKAQSLNCTIAVGYPELHSHTDKEYYNSLLVINPSGRQIANYRKSFLYYTDATWAKEGPGFYSDPPGSSQPVFPGKKTAMGICMDINPYNFTNPWNLYEFARHCLTVKANLVIISMAWLTLKMRERFLTGREQQPDMETLAYWIGRLEPLIRQSGGHDEDEEIIVVFANRCGWEDEAVYAGSSAVMGLKGGEVSVYGVLGRGAEECLVVDTEGEPMGRLVTRKRGDSDEEDEASPKTQQGDGNGDDGEKPTTSSGQPPSSSSNSNQSSQPPSSSGPIQRHQAHRHRPKLTLLTDPLTIPPYRSAPPIHLPQSLSISMTPQSFCNSLPTTPPNPHSPILWSISPDDRDPFSYKHATDATEITSFPVSFSSSFSPSFCSESFSSRSLSSLEDEEDEGLDANEFFEAWLVSPVEDDGRREKPRLGYWEEERLRGWKWPENCAREVDGHDEEVSPMTRKEDEDEEMIRIMASPSIFADLKMPRGRSFWEGRERRVHVR